MARVFIVAGVVGLADMEDLPSDFELMKNKLAGLSKVAKAMEDAKGTNDDDKTIEEQMAIQEEELKLKAWLDERNPEIVLSQLQAGTAVKLLSRHMRVNGRRVLTTARYLFVEVS